MGRLLHDGLDATVRRVPPAPALRVGDRVISYADLGASVRTLAGHLHAVGVRPGDRVGVSSTNRPELLAAVLAVSRLGAAAVLLSPAWRAAEVAHALALTAPAHIIGDTLEHLDGWPTTSFDALPSAGAAPIVNIDASSEALLVFSSGTTGMPKAVRHTHASMGAAVGHWVEALGLTGHDRLQVATPPTHILGILNLLAVVEVGASVRLHRRFDLDAVLDGIETDRVTIEMAVAPIALALAERTDVGTRDLSSLRYIMWGATPVTASVAERVTAATGVAWLPAYGASEVPVITANPVTEPDRWRLDSAGLPVPGVELRVVDLTSGVVLPRGGVGEVQVRSASMMAGYLPAAADAEAFDDGWYRTGDVGWLEAEGWLHLTDRSKEMIKVNGFQVAPAEVEAILHGHPAVADCAVFGVPDERSGEVPVAAVQLSHRIDVSELQQLVAESLATYKQLRHVYVVDTIPRLPSGKVLRRELREQWLVRA